MWCLLQESNLGLLLTKEVLGHRAERACAEEGPFRGCSAEGVSDLDLLNLSDQGLAVLLDELHDVENLVRPSSQGAELGTGELRRAVTVEIERVHLRVAATTGAVGGERSIGSADTHPPLHVRQDHDAVVAALMDVDPVPGIEPGSARWRRAVLPLDDTGMARSGGLEPPSSDLESEVLAAERRSYENPLTDRRFHCATTPVYRSQ